MTENEDCGTVEEMPVVDEMPKDTGSASPEPSPGEREQHVEPEETLREKPGLLGGRLCLKTGLFFAAGALLAGAAVSAMPYLNVLRYSGTEASDTLYACKVAKQHYLQFFFDGGNHGRMLRDTYTVRPEPQNYWAPKREWEPWERLESQTLRFRYAKDMEYAAPDLVVLTDKGADGTVDEMQAYTLTWDLSNGEDGPDWFSTPTVTREELDEETAALLDTILADYRERMDVETHCD